MLTPATVAGIGAAAAAPADTCPGADEITPNATSVAAAGSIGDDNVSRPDISPSEVNLEVKFAEQLAVRGSDLNLRSRRERSLRPVEAVLERHGGAELRPFLDAPAADRTEQVRDETQARTGERGPDLASWYTVTLGADVAVEQILADLPGRRAHDRIPVERLQRQHRAGQLRNLPESMT